MSNISSFDPDIRELPCGDGTVVFSSQLQSRIFCKLGDVFLHRADTESLAAARTAKSSVFINIGGNSLWPAPEGGKYAFFYPPGSSEWRVQDGIAHTPSTIISEGNGGLTAEKEIELVNRHGAAVTVRHRRSVETLPADPEAARTGIKAMGYSQEDSFIPLGEYDAESVLLAPWSLEQFPLSSSCVAFGKLQWPRQALNFDYYGMPTAPVAFTSDTFAVELSDSHKWQVGISAAGNARFIGVLDRERGLLFMRFSRVEDGVYFNIADNDQPNGPFAAADQMSIFHGGDLGFFELELIGAMRQRRRLLGISTLRGETWCFAGDAGRLRDMLRIRFGVETE